MLLKLLDIKTQTQFLSYIKITPKEYAEKLKAYWKNTSEI